MRSRVIASVVNTDVERRSESTVVVPSSVTPVSVPPKRIIYHCIGCEDLPRATRSFLEMDAQLSETWIRQEPNRRAYLERHPAIPVIFHCMDEKEQGTGTELGIPSGAENAFPLAGCIIGEVNYALRQLLHDKLQRAMAMEPAHLLLLMVIAHRAENDPYDNCAAHNHDVDQANAYVADRVERFNREFADVDPSGAVSRRYGVSIRLESITTDERRIWHGENGRRVDPLDYVQIPNGPINIRADLCGEDLMLQVVSDFATVFPYEDIRFAGLTKHTWRALLRQMAEMCVNNLANFVRPYYDNIRELRPPTRPPKKGHPGNMAFVGRGWEMWDRLSESGATRFFRICDVAPLEELRKWIAIAAKYMLANYLRDRLREGRVRWRPATFYVRIPFNDDERGDRATSAAYAVELGRFIRDELRAIQSDKKRRRTFRNSVLHVLKEYGIEWTVDADDETKTQFLTDPWSGLRIYMGVCSRETRLFELLATLDDL